MRAVLLVLVLLAVALLTVAGTVAMVMLAIGLQTVLVRPWLARASSPANLRTE